MSDVAIRVDHLSKRYKLGEREPYKSLREVLAKAARVPFKRLNGKVSENPGTIWALDDVSFEVKQGEAVGIIGRNGAGKSTLLKVLSRITKPTIGRADIYGRVGSLLEVGTGFHPELTGRENIYLNGAILGMKRQEIQRKFDEIVDFAEIEQFLDTPVKRYSSGMYVRLAFAVAAHLEPEILLVDEVLAVGDADFQKKCLGKMDDVAKEGKTVLFVSHNMGAVQRLCKNGLLINKGKLSFNGDIDKVVQNYLNDMSDSNILYWSRNSESITETCISEIMFLDEHGKCPKYISNADSIKIMISLTNGRGVKRLQLSVDLLDYLGDVIFVTSPRDCSIVIPEQKKIINFTVDFNNLFLLPKKYSIRVNLYVPPNTIYDRQQINFLVGNQESFSNYIISHRIGLLAPKFNWKQF
jgi:lipopolysaccharide transport system ATP-binding protein